jgi:hypothetical protein
LLRLALRSRRTSFVRQQIAELSSVVRRWFQSAMQSSTSASA